MSNSRSGKNNNRSNNNSRSSGRNKSNSKRDMRPVIEEPVVSPLVTVLITLIICLVIFLSNIGILGSAGDIISGVVFGIFGVPAYVLPVLAVILVFALYSVSENPLVRRRVICSVVIYMLVSILAELINGYVTDDPETYVLKSVWEKGFNEKAGGGIIFGSLAFGMNKYLSGIGTIALVVILLFICIALMMGRDTIGRISESSRSALKGARENAAAYREAAAEREARHFNEEDVYEDDLPRYARKKRGIAEGVLGAEPADNDKSEDRLPRINGEELPVVDNTPRREKKVKGVMPDTTVGEDKRVSGKGKQDDMHEIILTRDIPADDVVTQKAHALAKMPYDDEFKDVTFGRGGAEPVDDIEPADKPEGPSVIGSKPKAPAPKNDRPVSSATLSNTDLDMKKSIKKSSSRSKAYKMPPLNLLNGGESSGKKGSNRDELLDTAKMLQQTLETFGVKAKVTDISQGPSVTRFELQPESGVRVNKIVSLADDIKLSLAATDIRIEAPIPGKSAVGIEVPNKVSTGVGLRELLEDKAFKEFDSKLAVAIGKDIAGKTIVSDIAKMPHALIAGATGSGKSVCINTIIMSILYKAHPNEVKLIMIDPKVVELSVYNGIPHLMIPVVTDPKKAAAALNWGVAEMTERYKRFADMNVRDLKGYNQKIDDLISKGQTVDEDGNEIYRLPQIVIIVDELADLMMVAAKEVEESICRIAQLARACGIHLIIATQRPSVDVITGLIKANMPSRIAFAVSSGVDSRTILDMNGAEKLLGKGDMLFFPSGYPKPARIQGAFVSDAEVGKVVEFLKDQDYVGINFADIENKISNMTSSSGSTDSGSGDDIDDLFADAGRFIIAQDKASIGSLQRKFKIGFNRAARIMDQLAEAGVVSEDNGTKPRDVLMSPDQFEQYVEEYI